MDANLLEKRIPRKFLPMILRGNYCWYLLLCMLLPSTFWIRCAKASLSMAWRTHGKTNEELISSLKSYGIIKSPRVEQTMLALDRKNFCPKGSMAYVDAPQSIGYGATISAPHMHAAALDLLADQLVEGAKALDVGCGSGYLSAAMALMVGSTGRTIAIDHLETLTSMTTENLRKANGDLLDSGRIAVVTGDGRKGYAAGGPYDAIHVGAAAVSIHQELTDQLKPGGRMILPVGEEGGNQELMQVDKARDGTVTTKKLMGVMYVPLTSAQKQWPGSQKDL